jgi:8-oxo-dGTP diphosphatase
VPPDPDVLAAGGVVRRDGEVLVIHRPKYDDWTLPKGKLDRGETAEQAALREVEEETGFVCELGEEVESTTYEDRNGKIKLVRYWEMTPVGGEFEPNDEVDELRWVTPDEARRMLTYERDQGLP